LEEIKDVNPIDLSTGYSKIKRRNTFRIIPKQTPAFLLTRPRYSKAARKSADGNCVKNDDMGIISKDRNLEIKSFFIKSDQAHRFILKPSENGCRT